MSIFQSLRRKLHQRLLQQQLRLHRFPHHSIHFDKARSIGILFDGTELSSRDVVLGYADQLKKTGKSVRLLAFMDNRAESESFPFHFFNRKNLDWLMRPTGHYVKEFLDHPFDILLNLSMEENPALEYIAALSQAHFRVGVFSRTTHCYELMIDLPVSQKLPDLIVQIEFFLQKMQSTNEAAAV
ncbi:MAG: hypothetical protein IPG32_20765 [Saprospirales bacterium]|jgi:hypothetical protein|nr:hypothetical protein [Saprospirales bacterium]